MLPHDGQMSVPSVVRRHLVVHGMVQMVGFRWSCEQAARSTGVCGWVRNLPDGTVEAVLEGPPEKVAAMVDWCHHGPRGASVERVDVIVQAPQGESGFRVH